MKVPLNAWSGLVGADSVEIPANDPEHVEVFGYCDKLSYQAGDTVRVKIHTTAREFDAQVICDSGTGQPVFTRSGIAGNMQVTPENAYAVGCQWRDTFEIKIDLTWPSGVYLILLGVTGTDGARATSEAAFVVRPDRQDATGRLLLILTTGTYVAYNDWGGANSYRRVVGGRGLDDPAPRLSLERPWARGFLRLPADAPRYSDTPDLPPHAPPRYPCLEWALTHGYSRHYRDAGWASYERPFVRWAHDAGYAMDFVTQHDLHEYHDLLHRYSTVVIVGHDEYWTWKMRDAIDDFVNDGGNLARFAGNFIWQVRLEERDSVQVCYKFAAPDPLFGTAEEARTTTHWDAPFIGRPAATTMGLTGINGCYAHYGATTPRAPGGYTVYRPDHWVFSGSDLYYGDVLGGAPSRIAAFEVDGVDYTFRHGLPYPTHTDGAPQSLEILAMAPAVRGELHRHGGLLNAPLGEVATLLEQVPPFYSVPADSTERGAGMMAVFANGLGTVFNSGCCEWVSGLIHRDYFVERVTRNVLDRFLSGRGQ